VAVHRRDIHGDPDPVFFLGYWKNEAATAAKFTGDPADSWCRTGDTAIVDDDGYFWYQGRSDDDVVDLGLAEHLVDRDSELAPAVVEHRVANRLAGAHDRLQHQPVVAARLGHRLHHRLQRGRKQEGVGDRMAL